MCVVVSCTLCCHLARKKSRQLLHILEFNYKFLYFSSYLTQTVKCVSFTFGKNEKCCSIWFNHQPKCRNSKRSVI